MVFGLALLVTAFVLFLLPPSAAFSNEDEVKDSGVLAELEAVTQRINAGTLSAEGLSEAYQFRGILYNDLYLLDKALRDLKKSVEILPTNDGACVDLGIVHLQLGNMDEALRLFDKAISLNVNNLHAYDSKGYVFFYSNRYDEALAAFRTSLAMKPDDKYLFLWEFLAAERSGRSGRAALLTHLKGNTDKVWPSNLFKFFLGEIGPDSVTQNVGLSNFMTETQMKCEGYFYMGQYFILKGDRGNAEIYFRRAVDTRVTEYLEYGLAKKELERLTVRKK
jgi:lipoprotein NlpI